MVGICWCKNSWRASIKTHSIKKTEIGFELSHPLFDAIILKQGAQLIHFQPKCGDPLLWSASLATFEKGKAFRGGIPLCWPWFGKAGNPSHGFARIMEWEMVHCKESEESVALTFELRDTLATRLIWPYAFTTRLEMCLGQDVKLSLHVDAQNESSAALHSYFRCSTIDDVAVSGLGRTYTDMLKNGVTCESQSAMLRINQAVDRIYTQPEAKISLQECNRVIDITHNNHSDVVVWNPWKEGSKKLADMHNDDYRLMLCIETARISKPFSTHDHLEVTIALS